MRASKNIYVNLFLTFLISISYAVVRYNIFGNVPWEDLPLFITNKAIALTVVLLLFLSVIAKKAFMPTKKIFWKIIFILTSIHVFISFYLLGPEHFKKFYSVNELNLIGYLTLFFGISAFVGIIILNSEKLLPTKDGNLSVPESIKKIIRAIIPFLIIAHLFTMGLKGWLTPNNWHGYLIPISLIAFLVMLIYIIRIKRR